MDIEFVVKKGRVTKVIVGDYEFEADASIKDTEKIEETFNILVDLGVKFTKVTKVTDREISEFLKELGDYKKVIAEFKGKEEVKMDDLKKYGDLRAIGMKITRTARKMGLIGGYERALEVDWKNRKYRINPKLKKVLEYI